MFEKLCVTKESKLCNETKQGRRFLIRYKLYLEMENDLIAR